MAANTYRQEIRISSAVEAEPMPLENWQRAERLIVELIADAFTVDRFPANDHTEDALEKAEY